MKNKWKRSVVMAKIVGADELRIRFLDEDGDTWMLESFHDQECCEHHVLEMDMILSYNIGTATGASIDIRRQTFRLSKTEGIKFSRVDGEGIILYDHQGNRYFIAGRGYNNGYYGSNITLRLWRGDKIVKSWDVSKCQNIKW